MNSRADERQYIRSRATSIKLHLLSHRAMMPRCSRAVTTYGHRAVIVGVRVERAIHGPATEHVSVGMIERVGTGLLYRSLREHRRCDGRRENSGDNGWDEFCHDEHPLIRGSHLFGCCKAETDGHGGAITAI